VNTYLVLKALHIIAMVTWFAATFYLPRLFVYHASAEDEISKARFKVMERKLLRLIMNPSMILTFVFGIWMLVLSWQAYSTQGWIWVKLVLVSFLVGYHHYCLRILKAFADDRVLHSEKFLRLFNEVPVALLVGIVFLVVLKPF